MQALLERLETEMPQHVAHGIHVMVSRNQFGEWIIGDSHEYGHTFDPFDKSYINKLILDYLAQFCGILEHDFEILETWHGVYAKNPLGTEYVNEPEEGVKIITGFGGAGMTFSFGFAEEELNRL